MTTLYRLRDVAIVLHEPDGAGPEYVEKLEDALSGPHVRPELRMSAILDEVGVTTRAWYADLRASGMPDLWARRGSRRVSVFGEKIPVDVVGLRSQAWAQAEWGAMLDHAYAYMTTPLERPLPAGPVRRAFARKLEGVISWARTDPLERVGRVPTTLLEAAGEYLSPNFWRAPAGTWGRAAAAVWIAEGGRL